MTQPPKSPTTLPFEPRPIQCPGCHKQTIYSAENPWRPFCSKRCYSIDLGTWASEGYRISSPENEYDIHGSLPTPLDEE